MILGNPAESEWRKIIGGEKIKTLKCQNSKQIIYEDKSLRIKDKINAAEMTSQVLHSSKTGGKH